MPCALKAQRRSLRLTRATRKGTCCSNSLMRIHRFVWCRRSMYLGTAVIVIWDGAASSTPLLVTAGVEQRHPMSGTFQALAYDIVIRSIV